MHVHGLIHLVDGKLAVDLLHGIAGILHCVERLLVDIRRLDGVDLALQRHYLVLGLLERVLELLLTPKRGLGGW